MPNVDRSDRGSAPTLGNVVRGAFAGERPVSYQCRKMGAGVAPERFSPPTGHAWRFAIVCILQHVFVFKLCRLNSGLEI
jgi:hypothetical protein